jgi:predicted dehydrogenase
VSGLRLAGIAELDPQRLKGAGARFPNVRLHQATAELLSDDAVDVALIATPPSTHFDLACQAIAAGKHVVVEKPLCFTAAQADELLATALDAGVLLTVHQNRRWDPDFQAITRLIAEGRLGQVFNVETFVGGFEHPCTLWHSDRRVSGGRLYDWGAHLIDQTLQLYGGESPVEVSATGHKRVWHDVTNLDQVRVRMRFADGREAEFLDSDILAVRRPKYVVQGTAGTVVGHYSPVVEERVTADEGYQRNEHHHAEGPARLTLSQHHAGWGLQTTEVPGLPDAPFPFHRALADHLQLGDPIPVDPAEIRTVTAVLEAAHASAHDGGRLIRL